MVRPARRPSVRDRVLRLAAFDRDRTVPSPVRPEERVALRIEPRDLGRAGEVGEVVPPFAVLGLVVDDAGVNLDLAGRQVALEVRRVVPRVPQAELHRAEQRKMRRLVAMVRDARAPHFQRRAERHEVRRCRFDARLTRCDDRVAHAVSTRVRVEVRTRGLPRRGPELAACRVAQVEVATALVYRHVVVAIPREAAQPGVPVEAVAARGVRDDAEEVLAAEVVHPWQRGVGPRDHVLASIVVEVAEARGGTLPSRGV